MYKLINARAPRRNRLTGLLDYVYLIGWKSPPPMRNVSALVERIMWWSRIIPPTTSYSFPEWNISGLTRSSQNSPRRPAAGPVYLLQDLLVLWSVSMRRWARADAFSGLAVGVALLLVVVLARSAVYGTVDEAPNDSSLQSVTGEHVFSARNVDYRLLSTHGMGGPTASRELEVAGEGFWKYMTKTPTYKLLVCCAGRPCSVAGTFRCADYIVHCVHGNCMLFNIRLHDSIYLIH